MGAAIGEVAGRGRLGKRAMLAGAVAQSLPDIDFLAFVWTNASEDLLAHRGFTHSFLFIAIAAPLLSIAAQRWPGTEKFAWKDWMIFFAVQLFVHDFLDAFNAYGTGWFEPFSHVRVSFQSLFVADPFFTIAPALACAALLIAASSHPKRQKWSWAGIIGCILYLGYAVSNKITADQRVESSLEARHISFNRWMTTPTPLNTWLWWVVAEDDHGFYTGFTSLFDQNEPIAFQYFSKNDSLLQGVDDHEEVARLKRFSQGYYTASIRGDTLIFNDLRFGQNGWDNPKAPFVFNFYLNHPDENRMVIQRGRFSRWNRATVESFVNRIKGR